MKNLLLLTLLIISTLSFAQGTGEIIITEIHNRPLKPPQTVLDATNPSGSVDITPNEGHTEWFEVYNTTSSPVVMDGWKIEDQSSTSKTTVIGTFTLAANSYAAFAGYQIPDAQGGVVFDYIYDYKAPSFNNESSYADVGDTACPDGVALYNSSDVLVDKVEYDYGYGNYDVGACGPITNIPAQNSSSRTSFMLVTDASAMTAAGNDISTNWVFSTEVYDDNSSDPEQGDQFGTPGEANGGTLTISERELSKDLTLYPIPVRSLLNISSKENLVTSIEIVDTLGKIVIEKKSDLNTVNLSNLSKGLYFVNIFADGTQTTKRIVKN